VAFIVVYDACVLYPAPLRDLLLRIARVSPPVVRARWTQRILDECFSNILLQRPELDARRLERTRSLMLEAVPDCLIEGYEDLIEGLVLPDPDDRHVLAAAIRAGAQSIVTANLRDFPHHALAPYGIEALSPDAFVVDAIDLAPDQITDVIRQQAESLHNPPRTPQELLDGLDGIGLVEATVRLRRLLCR
jgi:PIN domain